MRPYALDPHDKGYVDLPELTQVFRTMPGVGPVDWDDMDILRWGQADDDHACHIK